MAPPTCQSSDLAFNRVSSVHKDTFAGLDRHSESLIHKS